MACPDYLAAHRLRPRNHPDRTISASRVLRHRPDRRRPASSRRVTEARTIPSKFLLFRVPVQACVPRPRSIRLDPTLIGSYSIAFARTILPTVATTPHFSDPDGGLDPLHLRDSLFRPCQRVTLLSERHAAKLLPTPSRTPPASQRFSAPPCRIFRPRCAVFPSRHCRLRRTLLVFIFDLCAVHPALFPGFYSPTLRVRLFYGSASQFLSEIRP